MTDAEALRLKPGDPLVGVISGRLAVLEAVHVLHHEAGGRPLLSVRRVGKTAGGYRFPPVLRPADELQRMPKPNAPAFHVAADWLEEHGHAEAAAHLRRAFPLDAEG
jgi:hypothetical protein